MVRIDLARLESGHTPSRKYPEYWGGDIPWISIQDAKLNHGRHITDTIETTNKLGIENSSARVLPSNTVCLSRTASVGYVVVMARPMSTSQDFVNWVCSKNLDPEFLKYLFIAEGRGLLRFASGAVHQTIYFPEAKAFHICRPDVPEQRRIVATLDKAVASIAIARANAEKNLQSAQELFESQLVEVFDEGKHRAKTPISSIGQVFDGPHATPKTVDDGPIFLGISSLTRSLLRKTVSCDGLRSFHRHRLLRRRNGDFTSEGLAGLRRASGTTAGETAQSRSFEHRPILQLVAK